MSPLSLGRRRVAPAPAIVLIASLLAPVGLRLTFPGRPALVALDG